MGASVHCDDETSAESSSGRTSRSNVLFSKDSFVEKKSRVLFSKEEAETFLAMADRIKKLGENEDEISTSSVRNVVDFISRKLPASKSRTKKTTFRKRCVTNGLVMHLREVNKDNTEYRAVSYTHLTLPTKA